MAVRTALIIPAAGQGERLGAACPKAFVELAGEPLLRHAVRGAVDSGVVDTVVVAVPVGYAETARGLLDDAGRPFTIVAGGATRADSVAACLAGTAVDTDAVLIHDAARCLTPPEVFVAVAAALVAGAEAVVPGVAVADTIKEVAGDVVTRTPDRATLRAIQTPQGLRTDIARRAHAEIADAVTDDASMAERLGCKVQVVPGHAEAFKITDAMDIVLAEAVLARREARS